MNKDDLKNQRRRNQSVPTGSNQGEGDKASAKRYNEAQQAFVKSPRGQDAIDQAGDLSPAEERDGERAESAGRSRAKAEDPAVTRRDGKR